MVVSIVSCQVCVSFKHLKDGFCFLIQYVSIYLFIRLFRPLIFRIITERYESCPFVYFMVFSWILFDYLFICPCDFLDFFLGNLFRRIILYKDCLVVINSFNLFYIVLMTYLTLLKIIKIIIDLYLNLNKG